MRFVDLNGRLAKLRRYVSFGQSVGEEEVKDPVKLAEVIRQMSVRLSETESRLPKEAVEFEVNVVSGGTVRLNHGLGGPVRWYVTHWVASESPTAAITGATTSETIEEKYNDNSPIVRRVADAWLTWTSTAAGSAQGCRYRMKSVRPIIGVRFAWQSAGAARTVTARIWNDSSGVSLANVDVSCNNTGVYNAYFASPITTDLTGVDITASVYNASNFTTIPSTHWKGLTIELNDHLRLLNNALTDAGDVRPTTTHGAAVTTAVEPILGVDKTWAISLTGQNPTCPELSRSADSTNDMLVLNSYSAGRAVIRVEPSQAGLT